MAQTNLFPNETEIWRTDYGRDGFLTPIDVISRTEAQTHRKSLEQAELQYGPMHYVSKAHLLMRAPFDLATHPKVLAVVEALLGPDILLFDTTYIIKEPQSAGRINWHQDLTYWGFDGTDQVSVWIALSQANTASGCMRMVPGSHKQGRLDHHDGLDANNILHRQQEIIGVEEANAVSLPLEPGQGSFHHGWTMHASFPNTSQDRRIGLNAQFLRPNMKQLINPHETARLVRGNDRFGHYEPDVLPAEDFSIDALARHEELDRLRKATWDKAG